MVSLSVKNLAKQLTPVRWRSDSVFIKFLYALVAPIEALYQDLLAYEKEKDYELSFTAQTIYLEHFLNDLIDNSLRRIYIEDNATLGAFYLYRKSEGIPTFFTSRNWKSSISYTIGQYVSRKGYLWKCAIAGANNPPELNSGHWTYVSESAMIARQSEHDAEHGYKIFLPSTYTTVAHAKDTIVFKDNKVWKAKQLTSTSWVEAEWNDYTPFIKSKYDKYNAAGISYTIETL